LNKAVDEISSIKANISALKAKEAYSMQALNKEVGQFR